MIRIAVVGEIGSGKSYVANSLGLPVFDADREVGKLYKKDKKIFHKLKKSLSKYIYSYPIAKNEISNAILANKFSLKMIIRIVHLEIRKKMNIFLSKNKKKKIVILDIPLLLENKIDKKDDVLVFVKSKKLDILKRLKKRKNYNPKLLNKFKNIQLSLDYKKKKSQFVIKNNFTNKTVNKSIEKILKDIL